MILNRGAVATPVTLHMEDIGDSMHTTYTARDLWGHANLSDSAITSEVTLDVPGHGVRLLRLWPVTPPGCPAGFDAHAPGYWDNTDPCPHNKFSNCTADNANATVPLCATKCTSSEGCVAFETFLGKPAACYLFLRDLALPFRPSPSSVTCVRASP